MAEADASLELILNRKQEMISFLSFYVYGAALARLDSARLAGGEIRNWKLLVVLVIISVCEATSRQF